MKFGISLILLSILASVSMCLYGSNSDVVILNTSNFQKEVLDSNNIWLVEFFAPWCGHCKNLAPEWEKAAKALKGIVKIGAVDADVEKSLGAQYQIQGFPTIKYFGLNKKSPKDYNSARSADGIVSFALDKIREITSARLGGKASSNSGSQSKSSGSAEKQKPVTDKDVVVLTDDNFEEVVMKSKDMWLVEFYAPWCGHCKSLEPHWNQAANELKGKVKVGKVDATVQQRLGSRFKVQGYPTIKIFPPGQKSDNKVQNYDGPRDSSGIVSIAIDKLDKFGVIPDVEQLTNQEQFKETCLDRTGVCVIAFLPILEDSSVQERKKYIDVLKESTRVGKGSPIFFNWVQGGDFFELEEKLSLGFGFPAVVAINHAKKKYSVMRSSFELDNIKNFISNLLIGKEQLKNLPELPKLKKVTPWEDSDSAKKSEDL